MSKKVKNVVNFKEARKRKLKERQETSKVSEQSTSGPGTSTRRFGATEEIDKELNKYLSSGGNEDIERELEKYLSPEAKGEIERPKSSGVTCPWCKKEVPALQQGPYKGTYNEVCTQCVADMRELQEVTKGSTSIDETVLRLLKHVEEKEEIKMGNGRRKKADTKAEDERLLEAVKRFEQTQRKPNPLT
jgi:hypothetical protein